MNGGAQVWLWFSDTSGSPPGELDNQILMAGPTPRAPESVIGVLKWGVGAKNLMPVKASALLLLPL